MPRQNEAMLAPLDPRLYKGAQLFENDLTAEGEQDMPYVITDGTMVALLSLFSDGKASYAPALNVKTV